ncbi:unnamed protein product [Mytilus edulis]|uniref:Fibrinogen C-terminal domain-containing protein n=1 Tax=Mytilus edulis TaxID=6550 RepID=A0A8S3V8I7_MYTED|nr:unnamed protein product [Mytilus edulis]
MHELLITTYYELDCPGLFACKDGKYCIPQDWKCNYIDNCADNSDEENCADPEIEETTIVKEVTLNETTTRTLSVANDSALLLVEETFPNTVNFTNFTTEKETFGGQCEDITGCEDTLFCIHNTCQCAGEDFWKEDACVHVTKKIFGMQCYSQTECQDDLFCLAGICSCPDTYYLDRNKCVRRKDFNSTCNSYPECKESLECKEDICQCRETDYWNGSYCVIKKTPGMTCSVQFECRTELHCLDCTCNCPDTEFLEGYKCLPKKELGGDCFSSIECQENLECDDDDTCVCKSSTYWNGMSCAKKLQSECEDIDSDEDGVYFVYPKGKTYSRRISVYCIMMGRKMDGDSLYYHNGYTFTHTTETTTIVLKGKQERGGYVSNLNGKYNGTGEIGVVWSSFRNYYSLKEATMMIRRR